MTATTIKFDPTGDVFFDLDEGSEWNACIGSQGSEEDYVNGYMEAALELATSVMEKGLYGQRDTLVLPILYNARHAVELALKFLMGRLHAIDMSPQPRPKDHDIARHYRDLSANHIGDEAMRNLVASLKPYVDSLSSIDIDGQMLRYPETQTGEQSMSDRPLANIARIRLSLGQMNEILERLLLRSYELEEERRTCTYTQDLSRRDLFEVARSLPPRSQWREDSFTFAKDTIKRRYGIGSKKFADALAKIEGHRELGALIGLEFSPTYLEVNSIRTAMEHWKGRHPPRRKEELGGNYFGPEMDDFLDDMNIAENINTLLLRKLSHDQLAELRALFYIGRDRVASEYYPKYLKEGQRVVTRSPMETVDHLITKTNFQICLADGLRIIGCASLAEMVRGS